MEQQSNMDAFLNSFFRINISSSLLIGLGTYCLYIILSYTLLVMRIRRAFRGFPESHEGKHWFWGHMLLVVGKEGAKRRLPLSMKFTEQFPRFFIERFGPSKIHVILNHPDTVKLLLKGADPKPTGFGGPYRHALPWLGEGLLIAGGKRWARARRLLTPAFHFEILKPYINVYNGCAKRLANNITNYVNKGRRFEIFHLVSLCTLDTILKCAFSYETDCQIDNGDVHPYVKASQEISDTWAKRNRSVWLHPDFIFYMTEEGRRFKRNCDYVHGVAEGVIRNRKKALEKAGGPKSRYLDFLDILLTAKDENGVGLSDIEIRNEVDTFLFEGHDTTASAISWILYSLALYPEHQKKCQQEIDCLLDGREDEDLKWDDLGCLEFLTLCIKEGMRRHAPVPLIARQSTKSVNIDGYEVPAGSIFVCQIYCLHNNPTVWKDPSQFRPQRFSKENDEKIDNFAYLPFSAGPRNCIGQHFALNEMKIILATLLRRFNFRLDPSHTVRKSPSAVMRTEDGMYMYAQTRHMS